LQKYKFNKLFKSSGKSISGGETMEEFLSSGANHTIEKHGMRAEDFYLNDIPANLLCHSFNQETKDEKQATMEDIA